MKPELNDLRILKLAEMQEHAHRRFLTEVAQCIVRDDALRRQLLDLAARPMYRCARIASHMTRLNERLGPADDRAIEAAALQDVLDVERAQLEFYSSQADRLHDPRVVRLFRDLVAEGDASVDSVRAALDRALAEMNGRAPMRVV